MATLTPLTPGNLNDLLTFNGGASGVLGDNSDSTFAYVDSNASGAYLSWWELGDVDADFLSMLTLTCVVRYGWDAAPSNTTWDELQVDIYKSDKTAILANANFPAPLSATSPTDRSVAMTFVDTGATKTEWDNGLVRIRIVRARVKGGDSTQQRIYEADFTGTYTSSGPAAKPFKTFRRTLQAVNRSNTY